jgi:hypothetical protein
VEQLIKALSAYEKIDPVGWVGVYRYIPVSLGLGLVGLGLMMLLVGGGRLFRLVAAPMGILVAMLWTGVVASNLGYTGPTQQITLVAMAAMFVVGLAFPPGVIFATVGIPVGIICGEAVGKQDWMLGFVPAFVGAGAIAAAASRIFGAVCSSVVGAWLLVIGALASLSSVGGLGEKAAQLTWGVIVAALLFAVAGVVFQLFVRLSPEERDQLKIKKAQAKRKAEDEKKLKAKWGKYLPTDDDE